MCSGEIAVFRAFPDNNDGELPGGADALSKSIPCTRPRTTCPGVRPSGVGAAPAHRGLLRGKYAGRADAADYGAVLEHLDAADGAGLYRRPDPLDSGAGGR